MRHKFRALLLFLALSLFSFVQKDVPPTPKEQLYFLKNAIDRVVYTVDPNINIGIQVISLKNGQDLYQKNADNMFVPASSQKIFTAAASLSILGADFRFETGLLADKPIENGVLCGDLYFKGSGDPSLSYRDLEEMVFQLKLLGLKEISGDLAFDNFDFDDVEQGPGWMWDEGADFWNAPLDALMVNHSSVDLWIKPKRVGVAPEILIDPCTGFVKIQNVAVTGEEKGELRVERKWMTRENLIQVSGMIEQKSPAVRFQVAIADPSLYTATLLHELLSAHKIRIGGKIVRQETPKNAELIACHYSLPLSVLEQTMLKHSDNLYANAFFKKMGQVQFGAPGTWQKGQQSVRSFLDNQVGLDVSQMVIMDGDGQSRYNLVSAHQLVQFLIWMHDQFPCYAEFLSALPTSGEDGTLKDRLKKVKGRVRAKSGTMRGISSLTGYVTTQDDEELAFAILINGFVKPAKEYKEQLEDEICKLLANFSRK